MLSYTAQNSDLYVFFEGNEIEDLEKKSVRGQYFNLRDPKISSQIKVSLDDSLSDDVIVSSELDQDGLITNLDLTLFKRKYQSLKEDRDLCLNEGARYIYLVDSSNLDATARKNYEQLKAYKA